MNRRQTLMFAAAFALVSGAAAAAPFTSYSKATFQAEVKSGAPVVVHVRADWCPTCRAQDPTLKAMSTQAAFAKVHFVNVNFDKDRNFLAKYKVPVQATIIVFNHGKEVTRFVGITNPKQLRSRIEKAL